MTLLLDDASIRRLVGELSHARGQEYQRLAKVASLRWTRPDTVLDARVQGSADAIYRINVMFSTNRDGAIEATVGVCSCPVHVNCKHVAAVLIQLRADQQGPGTDARIQPWERVLEQLIATEKAAEAKSAPLALQLELVPTRDVGQIGLRARPMELGARKSWVRGTTSWRAISYSYSYSDWDRDQQRVLGAIYGLFNARGHYYGDDQWLRLDELPPGVLWTLLTDGLAAGLSLIRTDRAQSLVSLASAPVEVGLDVRRDQQGLGLRPLITIDGEQISSQAAAFLGVPAGLLAYWPGDIQAEPKARPFSLARIDPPLTSAMIGLLSQHHELQIGADDEQRFLETYAPKLRTKIEISSADDSFALPVLPRPTLALKIEVLADHALELGWSWLYHQPGTAPRSGEPRPLYPPSDDARYRDPAAEQAVLSALGLPRFPLLFGPADPLTRARGAQMPERLSLTEFDTVEFLGTIVPALADSPDLELTIIGEPASYRAAEEAPVIEVSTTAVDGERDWFDLGVSVRIDGESVPFVTLFHALATGAPKMLLPSGTYFSLVREEFDALKSLILEARGLQKAVDGSIRISRFQAGLWEEFAALGVVGEQASAWRKSVAALMSDAQMRTVEPPAGLKATLRSYQQEGLDWLAFLQANSLGGILADDMGLGKTVQALAMILRAKEIQADSDGDQQPFLVVAPTSVVSNWAHEASKFAPDLVVQAISETAKRGDFNLADRAKGADLIITSYSLFRIDFEVYQAQSWSGLILDEAQYVKNHQSRGYQCARKLRAPFKLAITGTPMENNLLELWALFSITSPGLFGPPSDFAEIYQRPIERNHDADRLARLRRRIRPLMLRRTKEEVAADLPEKQEQVMELELLPKHRRVYQTHLQAERQKVLGLMEDFETNRFAIFRSLTLLRQLSLDASLYDEKYADIPSTKLEALNELITEILAEGHRVLIFSQFTRFLGKVRSQLDARQVSYAYLDGRTRNRSAVIDSFKQGTAPVFLISLKAGGVGLNLTEADYCILLDPWWNPAAEQQAIDRAHRIGQTKRVIVYRLVSADTIEDKVMALNTEKAELFSSVMTDSGVAGSRLSAADIRELLA